MSSTEVTTQTPAGWVALSAGDRHLVVQGHGSLAEELRGPLEAGLVELLEALSRDGLRALPDFALADTSGEQARLLVRGAAVVRADGAEVPSDGRMPWRDLDLSAAAIELAGPGGRGGWKRPSRFGRAVGTAAPAAPAAPAPVTSDADVPAEGAHVESEAADAEAAAPDVPPADLTLPPSEEYAGSAPADRVAPAPQPRPEKMVLIDSVPWRTLPEGSAQDAPPAEPTAPDGAGAADGPTGPDNWGLTGPTPVVDAPSPAHSATAPPADVTMDRSALNPQADGPADSPIVLAVLCPAGHHSSPHASSCRVCDRDIPTQQPFQAPRPQLGVLRVSTGGLVPLDRGVLLGRSPKVNADLPPSSRPHLVRLASRDNDISRNHAEVILEGWHVLVRDLGSTNGTTVTLPGQEPVRLRPTEDFGIEPGAVVTLADEVALTYEVSE